MTVRVLQFGDELELVNGSGTEVVVPGLRATSPTCGSARTASGATPAARPPTSTSTGTAGSTLPEHADAAGRAGVGAAVHRAALRLARPPHALDEPGPAAAGGRRRPRPQRTPSSSGPCRCATATPRWRSPASSPGARRRPRGWSGRSTWRWRCSRWPRACWPAPPGRWARCCSSARPPRCGTPARRRCRRSASPRTPARSSPRCCRR